MVFGLLRRRVTRPRWADSVLFRDLGEAELRALTDFVEERRVEPGALVVREGDPARELHVVRSGRLEVRKREQGSQEDHPIAQISRGELVGEIGVIDELPRSASVRALEPCELVVLHFDRLTAHARGERAADAPSRTAHQKLVLAVAQLMSSRLRAQGEASLAAARQRAAMGEFLVNILMLLSGYVIVLGGLPEVSAHLPSSTSFISIPIQLVFAVGSWQFIRSTGYPLHLFGLSFRHALGSLLEAVLFTAPFLAAITGVKWLMVTLVPTYHGAPLFEHPDMMQQLESQRIVTLLAIYALSSVVQELIVRSAIQSSLEMFLVGARRRQRAILMSALLFSVTHLHMSFLFAVLAFLPGVFWGVLYSRRPNLLGVSLSHVAVGGYVFFVLGTSFSG